MSDDGLLGFEELTVEAGDGPSLDELVLPARVTRQLELLIRAWPARAALFREQPSLARHFGARGISALLSGPSGTGKTAAARAVARRLGIELRIVSVAALLSSYMGETTKHVESVLRTAEERRLAILFDEADVVASARAGGGGGASAIEHVRTVGYLLSRLERFNGLAFFTTNRSLDPALIRRMFVIVEFHPLQREERREVWSRWKGRIEGARLDWDPAIDLDALGRHEIEPGDVMRVMDRVVMEAASEPPRRLTRERLERALKDQLMVRGKVS